MGGTVAFVLISGATTVATQSANNNLPICDGTSVTKNCKDESGTKYSKYIYHEAVEEVIDVPAKEAYTETVVVTPAKEAYYEKVEM